MRNRATARYRGRAVAAGGPSDELRTWIGASPYADYDARKLDRMFQDSIGQTAVVASADKIGLWLDGAQWGGKTLSELIAAQPEKVVNGTFDTDASGWTAASATLSSVSGKFTVTSTAGFGAGYQAIATVIGKLYRLNIGELSGFSPLVFVSNSANAGNNAGNSRSTAGALYFLATASTTYITVRVNSASVGTLSADSISFKEIPGSHGLNATASQRLNLLISSGRTTAVGDGSDDNLLTNWLAASGGNTILFDVDVPATIPSGQIIFGSNNVGATYYFVAFNPDGSVGGGVGGQSFGTIKGGADHRGKRVVGAITHDGSTVQLFTLSNGLEYGAAQVGIPNSTIPARIAAYNQGGSAGAYFTGGIARIVPIQKGGLTLADWQKIGPQFAAGTSLA